MKIRHVVEDDSYIPEDLNSPYSTLTISNIEVREDELIITYKFISDDHVHPFVD